MSSEPTESPCPRCQRPFHCGAADPTPCPCSTLKLPPALLATLRTRYDACLCLRCLAELAETSANEADTPRA